MKLALVIGHGPSADKGAWNLFRHVNELDWNRGLAGLIARHLEQSPVECVVVHREIEKVPPVARVNALRPGIAVELHCNAYDGEANGTEMLYWPSSLVGKRLAEYLQGAALHALRLKDRGVKPRGYGRGEKFLRDTHCPAVIWEPFFIDNDKDFLIAQSRKEALAAGFAQAVLAFRAAL